MIQCSRWSELTHSLVFHANLAKVGTIPCEFRFANGTPPVFIGIGGDEDEHAFSTLQEIFHKKPEGDPFLRRELNAVIEKITAVADELRKNDQKVVVIIASDGVSVDGNLSDAIAALQSLPVMVVLRLCTDSKDVVKYWNRYESEINELDFEVRLSVDLPECFTIHLLTNLTILIV